jgi:drug/metabolite transporter (DMT)-like permease
VFSVLRRVPLPRRLTSTLEAESGLNDAPTVVLVTLVSAGGHHGVLAFAGEVVLELVIGLLVGVAVGFAGVAYQVLADRGTGHVPLGPSLLVLFASACWGFGSFAQPRLRLPANAFVMTVYEMAAGGLVLILLGLVRGEALHVGDYPAKTWWAWSYLVVFGSALAFTAYAWLLANAPISLVATYAYVNPVVAVVLGALILDESVTAAVLLGGAIIVLGVVVVITVERPRRVGVKEKAAVART